MATSILRDPISDAQARLAAALKTKDALIDQYFTQKGFGYPDFTAVDAEVRAAESAVKVAEMMNKSPLIQDAAAAASVGIDGLVNPSFTPSFSAALIQAQALEKAAEAAALGSGALMALESELNSASDAAYPLSK